LFSEQNGKSELSGKCATVTEAANSFFFSEVRITQKNPRVRTPETGFIPSGTAGEKRKPCLPSAHDYDGTAV
jgi:hypothetical protein